MSEAQKYQGALYRPEKEKKGQHQNRNNTNNRNSQALVPQKASVEEVPDEYTGAVSQYRVLPEAPDPPEAVPDFVPQHENVNVFDFMVGSETPNPSTLNLASSGIDESRMITATPHNADKRQGVRFYDDDQAAGMIIQYGNGPVSTGEKYETPAPKRKEKKEKSSQADKSASKDKKRKRLHVDTSPQPPLHRNGEDEEMADADGPPVLHSGLTGGLTRLLRPSQFPPSPDYSGGDAIDSPGSPLKRNKRERDSKRNDSSKREERYDSSGRPRAQGFSDTIMGLITGSTSSRRDREGSSNKENEQEDRPRKSRHRDLSARNGHKSQGSSGQKLIEYSSPSTGTQQMIIYDESGKAVSRLVDPAERAELFLSGVTKGAESEKGYSINKALKRYHRERGGQLGAVGKKEIEEKELWRCLRLKRNDRGEVVVFFAE